MGIPPVNLGGEPVNSTRIRALLEEGDVARANALPGRAYFAGGPGSFRKAALGRSIGFPTLNLDWEPDLKAAARRCTRCGSAARREDGTPPLPGVANYGLRPTVEEAPVRLGSRCISRAVSLRDGRCRVRGVAPLQSDLK